MTPVAVFKQVRHADPWGGPAVYTTEFDSELVNALQDGPVDGVEDVSAAIALLDLADNELQAYGTDGRPQLDGTEIAATLRALTTVADRAGVTIRLPFRDFTTFRTYWNRKGITGSGSWQGRRDLVYDLLTPAREQLEELERHPRRAHLSRSSLDSLNTPDAILEQLHRIQRAIPTDAALAVGSAKELIESTAKAVLIERGRPIDEKADLPALVKEAQQALSLHPSQTTVGPDGTDAVKRILGAASSIAIGVAELRNRGYGTGHGAAGPRTGLTTRHAHLAVNAAITWCELLLDTLADSAAPWRREPPSE